MATLEQAHTTEDEIRFLDGLGGYCPERTRSKRYVKKLLEAYLFGAEKRTIWDDIDKDVVVAHATNLLRKLQ